MQGWTNTAKTAYPVHVSKPAYKDLPIGRRGPQLQIDTIHSTVHQIVQTSEKAVVFDPDKINDALGETN